MKKAYKQPYLDLKKAVYDLYTAANWSADRQVNEKALWDAVKNAAQIPDGSSPAPVKKV